MTMTTAPSDGDGSDDDGLAANVDLGTRLGRYELIRLIGAGGMGVVFEARDSELDRVVAIKVLSAYRRSPESAGRLRREGLVMARLAHPNVIRVYDVGVEDGHVFVAMELVRGGTLAEWLVGHPLTTAEVLATFLQAGRGLAAIHDAGLVHRDFKPQNVLVGDDGRVLVTDLGIAAVAGDDAPGHSGTPAYMAPEQRAGGKADARADQYSFCVALVRALQPQPPGKPASVHGGTTVTRSLPRTDVAGSESVRRGALGLPKRLRGPVLRGLDLDPARRFSSMHELLDCLEPRAPRIRGWVAVGAAGILALGGVLVSRSVAELPDPCPAPTGQLARAWDPARRRALQAHLAAVDPQQQPAGFATAAGMLDGYAAAWSTMHIEACRDTRVRGKQSGVVLDRRRLCLDRRLVELETGVAVLQRTTDPASVDEAVAAVAGLPSLAPCADIAALADAVPAPAGGAARGEFDALAREIAAVTATIRVAGQRAGLMERARAAVSRARRLGHPALLADALWAQAALENEAESTDAALASLQEHVIVAAAAHDDHMVVRSWMQQMVVLAGRQRTDEAEALLAAAAVAVARGGNTPIARFYLRWSESTIANREGDVARARRALADAMQALELAGANGQDVAAERVRARMAEAHNATAAGHWAEAAAMYQAIVPLIEARLGAGHADLVLAHFNAGVAYRRAGESERALAELQEAAHLGEARMSASPRLANLLGEVGAVLVAADRSAEALPYLQRAAAMARATMSPDDPRRAAPASNLGAALLSLDRLAEARAELADAVAINDHNGAAGGNAAVALFNLANVDSRTGNCRAAFGPLDRALAIYTTVGGPDSADVIDTLTLLARCQVQLGRWRAATATTERVLGSPAVTAEQQATARYYHGQALAGSGRIAAGTREVQAARDAMARLGFVSDLAEADVWLARNRAR